MYPDPSDWTSAAASSAWFYDVGTGRQSICQTNGWNFLNTIESDLVVLLPTQLPTFDGSMVDASVVQVIDPSNPDAGAWSVNLLRALYAVAQHAGAPSSYLQAIANDISSSQVSASTIATAAWIERGRSVDVSGNTVLAGSPADIRIPDGATLPQFGVAPPRPAQISGGFDCSTPIPANEVVPASTSVVPFRMDVLLVLVVLGIAVVGASFITTKIPVRPMRRNPRRRRRSRR